LAADREHVSSASEQQIVTSGRNADGNSRRLNAATFAIALTLSTVGCATTFSKSCDQSLKNPAFQAVRSSGGVAVTSAQYRIGTDELA
jgi:hypothetical protein